MADENSNSLDLNKLWKDDDEMRATLEKYVKICENCLFQFDQCLDHPSKEQILVPLKIIIRHLFAQTTLLYNGWKKSEENWIKKLNAINRKNKQKEAMDLYEWNILKAKMEKLKKSGMSSSKDTLGEVDSYDQEEANTITHANSPKRIDQSNIETKSNRYEEDRLFNFFPKEKELSDEKLTNQRLSIEKANNQRLSIENSTNQRLSIEKATNERLSIEKPTNERLSIEKPSNESLSRVGSPTTERTSRVGSPTNERTSITNSDIGRTSRVGSPTNERTSITNSDIGRTSRVGSPTNERTSITNSDIGRLSNDSQNTRHNISRPFHNSTDEFCKCQCEDYLISKHVAEIITSDCQCIVMQDVKPGKIGRDELKQTNKTHLSKSDYCQCCKCYE